MAVQPSAQVRSAAAGRPVAYPIGRAATLAGVSVRTLHHYDQIGLLRASGRSSAGYRVYGERDLERLAQIRYYRELGFSLDDVARVLDDPDLDDRTHLRRQGVRARSICCASKAEERLEVFGDFKPEEHEEEAAQRWETEDAHRESSRRAASYSTGDWLSIKSEGGAISDAFVALMAGGAPATDAAAMDVAERHRQHISRWFYVCAPAMHCGLGQMYVEDERYTASTDAAGVGLAVYMRDAFAANAARLVAESGPPGPPRP